MLGKEDNWGKKEKVNFWNVNTVNLQVNKKNWLNKHKENDHDNSVVQEMRKQFKCDQCDYKLTWKAHLKDHENIHHQTKEKKFSKKRQNCELCDKRFNKTETFNRHMRKEHKESQYE